MLCDMNSRLMPLEGAVNVRDVGGYRSASGPEIAYATH